MGILQNLTGWHALIILAIVILIFGATKLPMLAKSVGQSMKILKTEMKTDEKPAQATEPDPQTVAFNSSSTVASAPQVSERVAPVSSTLSSGA